MAIRSKWAKNQLKRLFELEGDALDLIVIHKASVEMFLESPITDTQKCRAAFVNKEIKKIEDKKGRLPPLPAKDLTTADYVYVIKSFKGKYKIGRAKNAFKRLQTLQTSTHEKLRLILKIKTNNGRILEKLCHRKFADKRVRGEWFDLGDTDLKWLRNLGKI